MLVCSRLKHCTDTNMSLLNSAKALYHNTFLCTRPFSVVFLSNKTPQKIDHCPMCIVMLCQSPRKSYVFLCWSGSCLLFSMCEGGKSELECPQTCLWEWGLMTWLGFRSFGRKREEERGGGGGGGIKQGGWNIDAAQVFTIKKPCSFITMLYYLRKLPDTSSSPRSDSRSTGGSTKFRLRHLSRAWDSSQRTNMVRIKPLFLLTTRRGEPRRT